LIILFAHSPFLPLAPQPPPEREREIGEEEQLHDLGAPPINSSPSLLYTLIDS